MRILPRLLLALAALFSLYFAAMFAIEHDYIRPSFESLEREQSRRDLARVVSAFNREAEHLAVLVRDWGTWDDTYAFAMGGNPHFVDRNLGTGPWKATKASIVAIYGSDGRRIYAGRYDAPSDRVLADDTFPPEAPEGAAYLAQKDGDPGITGIISSAKGIYLLASVPILRSDASGPGSGTFIMGRLVDESFAASLAEQTNVRTVMGSVRDLPLGLDLDSLAATDGTMVQTVAGDPDVHGFGLIRDLSGQPALVVRTETPREISAWSRQTIRISGAMIIVFGLGLCLLMCLMLVRVVISPLSAIRSHIGGFEIELGSLPAGLLARTDEIGDLARTFQKIAASLSVRDKALHFANENLEAKIEERTRELLHAGDKLSLLAKVVESTSEAIVITDLNAGILLVNEAFCSQSGWSAGELLGRNPRIVKSGRHGAQFYRALWDSLAQEGSWSGEIWDKRKNGEVYPKWLTINLIRGENGEPHSYVGISTDISLMKETEERLHQLAYYDPLTKLPNRSLFKDRLERAILQGQRYGHRVALLMIDLDRFKFVNDALGHEAGDQLLVEVARRITQRVRASDTVCRLGGDEFTVILDRIGKGENAGLVARGIIEELNAPFDLGGREIYIGASIGIAVHPDDDAGCEGIRRKADAAMYQAKAVGRNTFRFASKETEATSQNRIALESELRRAVERGEFFLLYQPIVDILDGRVIGSEALVRWRRSAGELVGPDKFIPLAEETGIILQLGEWVLRSACSAAASWRAQGMPMFVSVNISPKQFEQPGLALKVEVALAEAGLPPEFLVVEITETAIMRDVETALHTMSSLKELGVRIAIDDFGTGYSSLSYLSRFPIDKLKIDQSFTRGIEQSRNMASIVDAVIAMAGSLGIGTIAEGIETKGQKAYLESKGCHEGQGYLFSRPIDLQAFRDFSSPDRVGDALAAGAEAEGPARP
jgi:diguanylate cyclase (GGDEF)-like protein/PAS domain S-box-containing protein